MAAPRGFLSCHRLLVLSVIPHSTRQTARLHREVRNGATVIIASAHRGFERRRRHRSVPHLKMHQALTVSRKLQKNRGFFALNVPSDCGETVPQRAVLHTNQAAERPLWWCHHCRQSDQRQQFCDVVASSRGAGTTVHKLLPMAFRTDIAGCNRAGPSATLMHLTEIRGARENVVARIEGIAAKTVTRATPPCRGHDLHQTHGARVRYGATVVRAFDTNDIAYPVHGNVEAARGFRNERCAPIIAGRSVFGPTWCGNLDRQHASQEQHEREGQEGSTGLVSPDWLQACRRARVGYEIVERDEGMNSLVR